MLQRTLTIVTLATLTILLLLLTTTTPATAGPFGLLVIFITAYLSSLGLVSFFLYGATRALKFFLSGFNLRKPYQALSLRKSYYFGTVLALAPVLLIGLQSVGAVTFYSVILVVLFEVIGCLYITRRM